MLADDSKKYGAHCPLCDKCGNAVRYNGRFDAYFCVTCDEWRSSACSSESHEECYFDCASRPEKPSQVQVPA